VRIEVGFIARRWLLVFVNCIVWALCTGNPVTSRTTCYFILSTLDSVYPYHGVNNGEVVIDTV
jgi:hypothetical protein